MENDKEFHRARVEFDIDPLADILKMEVTDAIVANIENTKHIYQELFIQGHMILFCADSGVGKTSILTYACEQMALKNTVLYVNVDSSATDLKHYQAHAKKHGYKLINPDMTNSTVEDIVKWLVKVGNSLMPYDNVVVILDTLKKFTSVMDKNEVKKFNMILRRCTTKGMTIICPSHTNKAKDPAGNPVFEGVNDLRNDFDELIFLERAINPDGSYDITAHADPLRGGKARGYIKETVFNMKGREINIKHVEQGLATIYNFPTLPKKAPVKNWNDN